MDNPLLIAFIVIVAGLGIGSIVWVLTGGCSFNRCVPKPNRGLPTPKSYPPMPKVNEPKPVTMTPVSAGSGGGSTVSSRVAMRTPPAPGPRSGYTDPGYRQTITPPVEDNFALGMAVGMATDSALLGYAASGSLLGGMVGASLNNHSEPTPAYVAPEPEPVRETYRAPDPEPSYVAPSKSYDYSSRDDSPSPSYSSSSYDYSSSSSSSSSWSSSSDSSWSSSDSGSSWSSGLTSS